MHCRYFGQASSGDCGYFDGGNVSDLTQALVPASMRAALVLNDPAYPGSCGRYRIHTTMTSDVRLTCIAAAVHNDIGVGYVQYLHELYTMTWDRICLAVFDSAVLCDAEADMRPFET